MWEKRRLCLWGWWWTAVWAAKASSTLSCLGKSSPGLLVAHPQIAWCGCSASAHPVKRAQISFQNIDKTLVLRFWKLQQGLQHWGRLMFAAKQLLLQRKERGSLQLRQHLLRASSASSLKQSQSPTPWKIQICWYGRRKAYIGSRFDRLFLIFLLCMLGVCVPSVEDDGVIEGRLLYVDSLEEKLEHWFCIWHEVFQGHALNPLQAEHLLQVIEPWHQLTYWKRIGNLWVQPIRQTFLLHA